MSDSIYEKVCKQLGSDNNVIRMYDKNNKHVMSITVCLDGDGFDIATPDGKVILCSYAIKDDIHKVLDMFIEAFGVESL